MTSSNGSYSGNRLYPLKFKPILKERIWGGRKLAGLLKKTDKMTARYGESWELSSLAHDVSIVQEGFLEGNDLRELIEVYMGDLVGDSVFEKYGTEFPLLIKLIDTDELLSLQVHPDDQLAYLRHDSSGKNELWYVVDAKPEATIMSGFKEDMDKQRFLDLLVQNRILDALNVIETKPGDCFFIPAGRIHCISGGVLLAEIQQSSDLTYRITDWNRRDEHGNARETHLDLALDTIDYSSTENPVIRTDQKDRGKTELIKCPYFTCNLLRFDEKLELDYFFLDSFVAYVCVEGEASIRGNGSEWLLKRGETILVPAAIKNIELLPTSKTALLEIYIQMSDQ